jgi:hypothetical protein
VSPLLRGITWVSGLTSEKLRHGRLRLAKKKNGPNKLQIGKEGPSHRPIPFCTWKDQTSRENGLTPKCNCCVAVNFMSYDAGENIRGFWCEV